MGVCGADACTPVGLKECVGAGARTACLEQENGFNKWAVSPCEPGQMCQDGVCLAIECDTPGVKTCLLGGASYAICESDGKKMGWSTAVACEGELVCVGLGVCGEHECDTLDEVQCVDSASYESCQIDEQGFKKWTFVADCSDGMLCGLNGECGMHNCGPVGTKRCDPNGDIEECVVVSGGFLDWGTPASCDEGLFCGGAGACGSNQCFPVGTTECLSILNFRQCVADDDGFLDWSDAIECPNAVACLDGSCQIPTCTPADDYCEKNSAVLCGPEDGGIKVFLEPQPCKNGTVCQSTRICTIEDPVDVSEITVKWENRADVVALKNGGYAVVWYDNDQVFVRRFSNANVALDSPQKVATAKKGSVTSVSLSTLPTLNIETLAVVWESGSPFSISLTLVAGESIETTVVPNLNKLTILSQPVGVHLDEGKLGVFRFEDLNLETGSLQVSHSIGFPPTLSFSGPQVLMIENMPQSTYESLAASSISGGGAWVAHTLVHSIDAFPELGEDVHLVRVDADGKTLSNGNPVAFQSEFGRADNISVAAGLGDTALVVYGTGTASSNKSVRGHLVLPGDKLLPESIEINSFKFGAQKEPSVTHIEGVGFWAIWRGPVNDTGNSSTRILGRLFDESMTPLYDDRIVSSGNNGKMPKDRSACTTTLNDGRVVVVWLDDTVGNHVLRARILEPLKLENGPAPSPLFGSEGEPPPSK